MKKNKSKIMFWLSLYFVTISAWAATSPVPMLEKSAQKIIATLDKNKSQLKSNPRIVNQAISQYLLPHVDLEGMARSVLGRQAWKKATTPEKHAFTLAFTQLVVRTYANPIAQYSGEKVKFIPLRNNALLGKFIRVNSIIERPNGQKIQMAYQLVDKQGDWKIYDLNIEGVSLLQSYRSQFSDALLNQSIKTLTENLNKKI
jgi:phospholipid transport system substrate-binding protein